MLLGKDVLLEKGLLEKVATIKRFEYLHLGSNLKNHSDIAKDQYKLLKDQKNNAIKNNRENGVKVKDEIIRDVGYFYIGDIHKNFIDRLFKYGLLDEDLHLSNFDNQDLGLANIIQSYLKERNIDVDKKNFNVEISIKNLANMDDKVNMIMDYYKPKTKSVYYDKKRSC